MTLAVQNKRSVWKVQFCFGLVLFPWGHCGGGNIFIQASGNSGLASDCSGADGYMISIYPGQSMPSLTSATKLLDYKN